MNINEIKPVQTLDLRNLSCPMPLLLAKRALEKINPGDILEVQCSYTDVPSNVSAWCQDHGHLLMADIKEENFIRLIIKKK